MVAELCYNCIRSDDRVFRGRRAVCFWYLSVHATYRIDMTGAYCDRYSGSLDGGIILY
jgi:hypothetical protein